MVRLSGSSGGARTPTHFAQRDLSKFSQERRNHGPHNLTRRFSSLVPPCHGTDIVRMVVGGGASSCNKVEYMDFVRGGIKNLCYFRCGYADKGLGGPERLEIGR